MAQLLISQPWFGTPIIRQIIHQIVFRIIQILVDKGELGIFIVNSKILTSQQAQDYREAIEQLKVTPDASLEEAERKANEAFSKLVSLTR